MIPSRTRLNFRYEGDREEVVLRLTAEEARTIASACVNVSYDDSRQQESAEKLGTGLEEFLDATENSNAMLIKPKAAS